MKKLILLTLVAVATFTSAFAEPAKLNLQIKKSFEKQFGYTGPISWKTEDNYSKISYLNNGIQTHVFYNPEGELIGTTQSYALDKLPTAALDVITTKYTYPEYEVKECIAFTSNDQETNYYVLLQKDNQKIILEISENGNTHIFAKNKI